MSTSKENEVSKVVDIGILNPGDLCIMDGGRLAKVLAHERTFGARQEKTTFEDEHGAVDWVWSNYKVEVD